MNAQRQARYAGARPAGVLLRRSWLLLTTAAVCLGLPLLASCSTNPGANTAAEPGDGSNPPLVLRHSERDPRYNHTNAAMGGASMQERLAGTLIVGRGDCLGVATDKGTAIPAFPQTAVLLDGGRPGIDIQGRQYRVGDQVSFGGGLAVLGEVELRTLAPCLGASDTDIFLIQSLGP